MTSLAKSTKIRDYKDFNWSLNGRDNVKYPEIINFERAGNKGEHHCVMCGTVKGPNCVIPNQNKDVCKICDSSFWLLHELNVLVKFCKGCKKFSALQDFDEKPEASKCAKCRKRGRQNYYTRKQEEDDVVVNMGNKNNSTTSSVPLQDTTNTNTTVMKNDVKGKEQRNKTNASKPKKEKKVPKNPPSTSTSTSTGNTNTNTMVLNKKSLHKLQKKDVMNDSGETDHDQSSSTLNVTSSTSSESCPSPNSYQISSNKQYHQHHPNHMTIYQQNHSFSSPSFNETSELDILGFHPDDTDQEIIRGTEDAVKKSNHRNNSSSVATSSSSSLQIPFPFRPSTESALTSQRNSTDGLPPHPMKLGTPSNITGKNNKNGHEPICPDSTTSIVSCSSDTSGGTYFSNSYLWPDTLKEMERNASRGNSLGTDACGGTDAQSQANNPPSIASSHDLANNPMSCFQLPTGFPSTVKKPSKRNNNTKSKGVGHAFPTDNRGSSRGSSGSGGSGGSGGGVVHDRRGSHDSASSSSSSSKNSSLSSIGSAGGFPINHFGDLSGMGVINQANTPGLLLSITPQSGGLSFTPHGPGGGGTVGSYDVITPFSGTPMFSHSPFDSINTPDSNWKWDPSANALMNLASISAEVLTNTPPAEDRILSPELSNAPGAGGAGGDGPTAQPDTGVVQAAIPLTRKCSSDPGKVTTTSSAVVSSTLAPPSGLPSSMQGSSDDRVEDTTAVPRTSVMSEEQNSQVPVVVDKASLTSSEPVSPFRSTCPQDDNIYLIALDSSQSLELSPQVPVSKKRSLDDEDGEKELDGSDVASSSVNNQQALSSSNRSSGDQHPAPAKKLRL